MDAIKFERTQIHFLATFSLPSLLKVPYVFGSSTTFQRRREWICESGCQVSGRLHVFAGFFALKPLRDYILCSVCIFPTVCSPHSAFCTQPAFYSKSAVCLLHSVCILPLVRCPRSAVRSPQSAVRSLPLQ